MSKETSNTHTVLDDWTPPQVEGAYVTGLQVNNSLAGRKVPFVPNAGKIVNWYGCGPTVYDSAHMGHARNYLTFDIIRRIMENYFGYDVNMCMNVTDIDDKIIARAAELNVPFDQLARYWENDFWKCLQALECKLPDVVTRVSEFIPEILKFIERIVANGFAYHSQGSVYFDTSAFQSSDKHCYGRMEPWSVSDTERVLEGEGGLGVTTTEKRCPQDFALWKMSKPGEPSWPSPWGPGRPGWHIECSTMASEALGFPLDLHSGGIDLRFPHHDNELAQSEAAYDRAHWINYFLHSGHLHIQGLKMSKSLKNFITIDAMLEKYPARVLRLLVLLHRWDQPMNFNPDGSSMTEPLEVDRVLLNFFATMKQIVRKEGFLDREWTGPLDIKEDVKEMKGLNKVQKWTLADRTLYDELQRTMEKCHIAMCDNFDTPAVITQIQGLMSATNIYVKEAAQKVKAPLISKVTAYIHHLLSSFGMMSSGDIYGYGGVVDGPKSDDTLTADLIDCLGLFRKEVRDHCRTVLNKKSDKDPKEVAVSILKLCDLIRDENLPRLGIRLEDQGNGDFIWKQIPK